MKGLTIAAILGLAAAECPNACSGHGDCGAYDMCTCWRNWQSADCSERTCPFGNAHVDTPKGDLNMDNSITTSTIISNNYVYWYGTEEKFPAMQDSANGALTNSAHHYMECSNKGLCDRESGICECFDGYEGSACQRASCPNQCSGHGTCESIRELSKKDYGNIYELWDRDMTYGCKCDGGYSGPDCSIRNCKYGFDPLYYDDEATYRINEWNIYFDTDSTADGTFEIEFFDVFGENYVTNSITYDHTTKANNCNNIKNALEALPNTVVPVGSVTCARDALSGSGWDLYTIAFTQNAGPAKTPALLKVSIPGVTASMVYAGAISGEFEDFFYTKCEGLTVTIADAASVTGHTGAQAKILGPSAAALTVAELKTLKKCLGDSNGLLSDNVDIENWDTGLDTDSTAAWNIGAYPHAIKLVPTSTSTLESEGGLFYLTYFSTEATDTGFYLSSGRGSPLVKSGAYDSATTFYVYTTDAVAQVVFDEHSSNTDHFFSAFTGNVDTRITARTAIGSDIIYTSVDASCENDIDLRAAATGSHRVQSCLGKGDKIFLIDLGAHTTYRSHLYEVKKIWVAPASSTTATTEDRYRIQLDKPVAFTVSGAPFASIYKFHTGTNQDGNKATFYEYAAQCSNRGLCDNDSGICKCFKGYTGDACQLQSSFAL